MQEIIKKIRRSANWGLYGSLTIIIAAVIFHFCPYQFEPQTEIVTRCMLIAGIVFAVLGVLIDLNQLRNVSPKLRQLDDINSKLNGYSRFINGIYCMTFVIVIIECTLITLSGDTSLLMVTILLVLLLFLSYPNMYKIQHDLGFKDEEMIAIFGDAYIPGIKSADTQPGLDIADAKLEQESKENSVKNDDNDSPSCQQ